MLEQQEYLGTYIGGYQLTAQLSTGSSSYTFLAETASRTDRQQVVVKWYYAVHLSTPQEKKDFLRKASMLKHLQQPFILPLLATGLFIDTPYIVTPYMSKGSLYNRIHNPADQAWLQEHAETIIEQIGQALAYSHQQNVAHGKLHPGNILFNERDEVQLTDFQLVSLPTALIEIASIPVNTIVGQKLEYYPGLATKDDDHHALGNIAHALFIGCKSSTHQTSNKLCDSQNNMPPKADTDTPTTVFCTDTHASIETPTIPPTPLLVGASTNRDISKNLLVPVRQKKDTRGGLIRRVLRDQGSVFLLSGILCIIIFSIVGTQFAINPHNRSVEEERTLSLGSTSVKLPTPQPTSSEIARTNRLIDQQTPIDLLPYLMTPAIVQHDQSTHRLIGTPSSTPSQDQFTPLTVNPTYLNPQTCKLIGEYYTCTVILALSANSQRDQSWYSSSNTTATLSSPASGFIKRGSHVPITIQVGLNCYGSGTITFIGNNTKASLTWSC